MKVCGYRRVEFNAQDGKHISGVSVFCSYPITKNGDGVGFEKIFMSDNKLGQWGYYPEIGDEINVSYNRFGKVDSVTPIGK